MSKVLLTFSLLGLFISGYGQISEVEKSTYGIQTGFLGVYIYNELKVSKSIIFRIELGLDNIIWGGSFYSKTGFAAAPVLTIEPRWYFNLQKRYNRSKTIKDNNGDFLSVKCSYHPDLFVISNYTDLYVIPDITIIPTWGIRRNIGKHFNL